MKKYNVIFIVVLIAMVISKVILASQEYKLIIDGRDIECDMIRREGINYLPVNTISKELNLNMNIDDDVIKLDTTLSSKADKYRKRLRLMDQEIYSVSSVDTVYEMKQTYLTLIDKWEETLNEIYKTLEEQLSGSEMELMETQQRDWIEFRDIKLNQSATECTDKLMQELHHSQVLVYMTRQRCYELLDIYME